MAWIACDPAMKLICLFLVLLLLAVAPEAFADSSGHKAIRITLGGDENSQSNLELPGFKITLAGPPWLRNTEALVCIGLFVWSLIWICQDAGRRGKNGFGAFIFAIAACYPLSLLWWLWLRPPRLRAVPPPIPGSADHDSS